MTLTEFLLARIDDDEGVITSTLKVSDEPASSGHEWTTGYDSRYGVFYPEVAMSTARALSECEAKRRIIKPHVPDTCYDQGDECAECSFHEMYEGFNDYSEPWPCPTLRALAAVYQDHPDYDEAWRL